MSDLSDIETANVKRKIAWREMKLMRLDRERQETEDELRHLRLELESRRESVA